MDLIVSQSRSQAIVVPTLVFVNCLNENMTVRLTVDGTIIYNDTVTVTNNQIHVLGALSAGIQNDVQFWARQSLLLEINTTTDTAVSIAYVARPVL